jgi:hypothetical protein
MIALIAGLLLLPVSLVMIASFDEGPLGRAAESLGLSLREPRATATVAVVAQNPTPTTCPATVINGLVVDATTGALLGNVQVDASFGGNAVTSPDGEYNIPVACYDAGQHDSFSLAFTREGYASANIDVTMGGYPGIVFVAPDVSLQPLAPTPTPCRDTVFNGIVLDAATDAWLGGVEVEASFGAAAVTSPDGEYNILVCYDPSVHDSFSLTFTREGYQTASLDVTTTGFPGISSQVPDLRMIALQDSTPVATLFQPPRQTPLPTLMEPPRQTPLPTPTPTLFQPPRQTPLPTATGAGASADVTATVEPTRPSGDTAPTPEPGAPPPNTLPVTGLPVAAFPGQAVGFVLLALSLILIAAGVWPQAGDLR